MAHWKKSFPSTYLQAADLDVPFIGTVDRIVTEHIGTGADVEDKPVVYWREPHKGVVLNLTRCEALEAIARDPDMDKWVGKRVCVFRGSTRYGGKRVPCIAFKAPDDDIDETLQPLEQAGADY